MSAQGPGPMALLRMDRSITRQKVTPGTVRRILPYAARYRWQLGGLLLLTALDAGITALSPLLLEYVIDDGIVPRREGVLVGLALLITGLAVLDAAAVFVQTWLSGRIGQGLVCDLRTRVFDHVQSQPLAFFVRAQTGSLVSRLNSDVVGAQQALSTLFTQTLSTLLTLALVVGALFYLSWQITVAALVLMPCFLIPFRLVGRRTQRLTRETMQLDADMGSMMNERFNVSGAQLAKLYGRPAEDSAVFAGKARKVRDLAVASTIYGRLMFIFATLLTTVTTALVYGLGGTLVVRHELQVGTLVAMVALLARLYGPVNQLSNIQILVMTALVSFDRVFEVLDLKPLITERTDARELAPAASAPEIVFDRVGFRYPVGEQVSLASLESVSRRAPERTDTAPVLDEISFRAPAGRMTALVGPSGGGKTTITSLVPRLYDPTAGTVLIGGQDVRDLTLDSVRRTVGVVPQDTHLFHDTLRANLLYARPGVTDRELREACEAALIWDTVSALPDGLDTVVGDRGHRLSGGEKQRVALARLLLKSPPVVVLDEATAHLDSESEAAIQRALKTALADRTSLVIAHRLSTIRDADQILVVEAGRIRESGSHGELLEADGLYAELFRTQFAQRPAPGRLPSSR